MPGLSASIRRAAKSVREKLRSRSNSSHDTGSIVNDPELASTSNSDTLRSQDESKDGDGLQEMAGPTEPFPPFNASAELNVPRTTRESLEHSRISTSDGQQDDELTNENAAPEHKKDNEPAQSATSNQNPEHFDAKSNDTISKPAPGIQEIKRPVLPTPPESQSAIVPHEQGPLTLPPPLPANAWTMTTTPSSSTADVPIASAASTTGDATPVPSFQLSPPTPPSATSATEEPLLQSLASSSAPPRANHSEDEERGRARAPHCGNSSTPIPGNSTSAPTASASTSADTPTCSSSVDAPPPHKSVGFAKPSSYRNGIHHYNQSSPPKSVGKDLEDAIDRPPSTSGSKANSSKGIMKQPAEHKQGDANPSKAIQTGPPKVYIVVKDTATTKDGGPWDQVLHDIQGVYFSERDANNKVIKMHNDRVKNIAVDITLWQRGHGSPFYRWETNRMVRGRFLYRVHVVEHELRAASNEPELIPINKVRSMLNV